MICGPFAGQPSRSILPAAGVSQSISRRPRSLKGSKPQSTRLFRWNRRGKANQRGWEWTGKTSPPKKKKTEADVVFCVVIAGALEKLFLVLGVFFFSPGFKSGPKRTKAISSFRTYFRMNPSQDARMPVTGRRFGIPSHFKPKPSFQWKLVVFLKSFEKYARQLGSFPQVGEK